MKRILSAFALLFLFIALSNIALKAQPIPESKAIKVAGNWLLLRNAESFSIQSPKGAGRNSIIHDLFYLFPLHPQGYIVISALEELPPVIAYSFENNMDTDGKLLELIRADLSNRLENQHRFQSKANNRNPQLWADLLENIKKIPLFKQWPAVGSTASGGWIETNWHQDPPYNDLCPMDPVSYKRSLAGCPSVAMAQIVNYHHTTNGVIFSDTDDYYHAYSGRNYWIDNDHDTLRFPSFPELNTYLGNISASYQQFLPLTDEEKAALVFACGVAATQVYTSSGSGTFGVDQAFEAFQKFNFNTAELIEPPDTSLFTRMAQNIMNSLPVHLAVVNPSWTSGHNVVADGYNTDKYFHLNFGWGGASNGWYLLPNQFPYGLTVIEGVVTDIIPTIFSGVKQSPEARVSIFPNPATSTITVLGLSGQHHSVEIYNLNGKLETSFLVSGDSFSHALPQNLKGLYMLRINNGNSVIARKLVIQ